MKKNKWGQKSPSKQDPISCEVPTTLPPTTTTTKVICDIADLPGRAIAKWGVWPEEDFNIQMNFKTLIINAKFICDNGKTTAKVKVTCQARSKGRERWVLKGNPLSPPKSCRKT